MGRRHLLKIEMKISEWFEDRGLSEQCKRVSV
jgi:hypothetical protein